MQKVHRGIRTCCWELSAALLLFRCCMAASTQALQVGACSCPTKWEEAAAMLIRGARPLTCHI